MCFSSIKSGFDSPWGYYCIYSDIILGNPKSIPPEKDEFWEQEVLREIEKKKRTFKANDFQKGIYCGEKSQEIRKKFKSAEADELIDRLIKHLELL